MAATPNPSSAELLSRLVAFDTTSSRSNLDLIGFVRAVLDGHGVPYRLTYDETGRKANLHARIGPDTPGGIVLSGHVDTVPVDGQAWSTDPFALTLRDGRLHGRGTADMKGFVACCLAAVPHLLSAGLRRPMHLFISYDEEVGCLGIRRLLADLHAGVRPAWCVVGEPTSMQPVLAHKGRLAAEIVVRGRPGHSSAPARGVNAVVAAAEAITHLAAEGRRFASDGPFEPGFDPPCSTVHVGPISGGGMLNIIPEHARFEAEWRMLPGLDAEAELDRLRAHAAAVIEPAMHAVDPGTGFAMRVLNDTLSFSLDPAHDLAALTRQITGSNSTGKVSYGTEAGFIQQAGIPTIVCGPGDIAQAHGADEWIAQSELAACDGFIRRLSQRLAA